MKRRVTFLVKSEDAFHPDQLRVTADSLSVQSLEASREERLTFGTDELPNELLNIFKQCHELHIRWASERFYSSISPLVSRVSPGLHVFFTPQKKISAANVCPLLQRVFGAEVKCASPEASFSRSPTLSGRFSHSSTFQYYHILFSLKNLVSYLQSRVCKSTDWPCHDRLSRLERACYIDIDFDAISQTLMLKAFWDRQPDEKGVWNETFKLVVDRDRLEVGILANEKPVELEELSLGGYLVTIREDDKLSATRFSFPSRHHPIPQSSYAVSFFQPTGLHPTLRVSFPKTFTNPRPPQEACAAHVYVTLPSYIFADKYQLSDPLFLASKNLRSVRSISGETDLEAPDWVVQKWGSALLVELSNSSYSGDDWSADIPLHLRYLPPGIGGTTKVHVPWPVVFWACRAEEGLKMGVNPFDRVNLGYDGLFGPRTMFYHLSPDSTSSLVEMLQLPVMNTQNAHHIEVGTFTIIVTGFIWLWWKLFGK